jgi:hypothetical protein
LLKLYGKKRDFRCINLGSRNYQDGIDPGTYSIFRYGLLGQGSVITSHGWSKIKKIHRTRLNLEDGFDGIIENYIKTGFGVWPNTARILDLGWDGTHGGGNPTDLYFTEQQKSWEITNRSEIQGYSYKQISSFWRKDRVEYTRTSNLYYWIRFIAFYVSENGYPIRFPLRRTKPAIRKETF